MISTKQQVEVLEKIVAHFEKQGKKAVEGTTCRYRTPDGDSCAIGCLIPDAFYVPEMDNQYSGTAVSDNRLVQDALAQCGYPVDVDSLAWFRLLQSYHDKALEFDFMLSHYRDELTWYRDESTVPRPHPATRPAVPGA